MSKSKVDGRPSHEKEGHEASERVCKVRTNMINYQDTFFCIFKLFISQSAEFLPPPRLPYLGSGAERDRTFVFCGFRRRRVHHRVTPPFPGFDGGLESRLVRHLGRLRRGETRLLLQHLSLGPRAPRAETISDCVLGMVRCLRVRMTASTRLPVTLQCPRCGRLA